MDKDISIKKLRNRVKKVQDEKRFEHTLGVEFTAAALAMRYGEDIKAARIAGILHDCAKCFTEEKLLSVCKKNGIEISEVEKRNPFLLHGRVGAFLAEDKYGIDDQDIINAISYHTTGRGNMSLLEKIIFIADYMEPGRKQAANLAEIRMLAFQNIDACLIKILEDTLKYLEKSGKEIDDMTRVTYEYYTRNDKKED